MVTQYRYRLGAVLAAAVLLIAVAACAGQQTTTPPAQAPAAATSASAPAAAATTAPAAGAPTTTAGAAGAQATTAPAGAAAPTTAASGQTGTTAGHGRGAGGELKLLFWQAPTILNTYLAQGTKDEYASSIVTEPLAWFGADGKPVRVLAADIPTTQNGGISSDGKTVTWKLKPNIKWSDGSDFTADDVVFTYQYNADPTTASTQTAQTQGIDKVEAVDKNTVKITFKEATATPYQIFVGNLSPIIQKKQFQDYMGTKAKDAPGNLKPIGTGPYKVDDFKPGDVITYSINDNYREADKPFFKTVQLKGGGDATSAARAVFQTGETDYAWNLQVPWAALNPMISSSGSKGDLLTATSSSVERILLNRADPNKDVNGARSEPSTQHPILSDLKVRQALSLAIDRNQIADQLYGKGGGVGTCNLVVGVPELESKNTSCAPDIAKANQLLDEAGWTMGPDNVRQKNGQRLHLVYQTTVNPTRQATQDLVKAAWAKIGVETELKAVNSGVFFSTDVANPDTAAHFYTDVEMFTNNSQSPDFIQYLQGWTSKEIAQKSNEWRGANYERWSNPDYDKLMTQIQTEMDATKRAALIVQANDMLINDVVDIPLVARAMPESGKSKDLKGPIANSWDTELWNIADWYK
ncbi:MAG: peptide ABC transporter substrate-binding protein [Anaerolineae bacterium]